MSWWQEVLTTAQAEFAGLTNVAELTRVALRLATAAVLGGILGFEREHRGKAAGVRTHMLVCMGAALFVLAPEMAGTDDTSLSRVIQGIVAGIGFLGAGTILKERAHNVSQVKGLTTAAGLWMTAAIGVAAGTGREVVAILSTLLALGILGMVPHVVDRHERKHKNHRPSAQSDSQPLDSQDVS
ncbi:MgtC/SapB family protein [Pseudomonas sp. DTU_2021_1001937_2_SI_NGA_ILE_001]|uniref:MgtC/SapB family protein n=1 Tax=Pseudomonas sp. DTU_2021_1001937_2_SI_NGA_ILE_001 TaxID=3077589 RepID=UPI0028FC2018|nr:MgtC/SapB family protein [Pseudomonas sp. DTU_2021_1001937_2_SI_NGA_ILE_001]WNW10052.1 MgtC/SapB family protein [Pseudomonas sp. DTU_2021_1001937_2_SI_NGA_ILE_001]